MSKEPVDEENSHFSDAVIAKLAEERRQAEHTQIDENADRHAQEVKLELLKAEYAQQMEKWRQCVQEVAQQDPGLLARMACEAAMGESQHPNLFNLTQEERQSVQRLYADLPGVILAELSRREARKTGAQPDGQGEGDFVRLCDWITRYASFDMIPGWKFDHAKDLHMLYTFFDYHEDAFGYAIVNACELVYHGLPLYEFDEESNWYTAIAFSHEDYIYLLKKGQHSDQGPRGSFPYWAKQYYFKRHHLEAHRIFFAGVEPGDPVEKVVVLRTAFRHHIGFSETNTKKAENGRSQDSGKSPQSKAAMARWAPHKEVQARALELYEARSWPSRAEAVRRIKDEILRFAKEKNVPLSESNAESTIGDWLKELGQKNG